MNNNDNTDKQTPEMWRQDAVDEDADGDVADAADLGLLSDNSTIYIYIYIYIQGGPIKTVPLKVRYFSLYLQMKTELIVTCQRAVNFECVW